MVYFDLNVYHNYSRINIFFNNSTVLMWNVLPFEVVNINDVHMLKHKAFRLVVRSSFVFASSNCDWLKLMTSSILPNRRYCLQIRMKIEPEVEMP